MEKQVVGAVTAASQALSARVQVAAVLEGLLDDIEVWEWANRVSSLEAELRRCRRDLTSARESQEMLSKAQADAAAKAAGERDAARTLRDNFVKELWHLSKEVKAREAERRELAELHEQAQRVPKLERELQAAQRQLARAQIRTASVGDITGAGGSVPPAAAAGTASLPIPASKSQPLATVTTTTALAKVDAKLPTAAAEPSLAGSTLASASAAAAVAAVITSPAAQAPAPASPPLAALTPPAAAGALAPGAAGGGGSSRSRSPSPPAPLFSERASLGSNATAAVLAPAAAAAAAGAATAPAGARQSGPPRRRRRPRKCALLRLDDKTLLRVYSLLDPEDVLNTAYLCRPLYRKVNALFGIGEQGALLSGGTDESDADDGAEEDASSETAEVLENAEISGTIAPGGEPAKELVPRPPPLAAAPSSPAQQPQLAAAASSSILSGRGSPGSGGALGLAAARAMGLAPQALVAGLFGSVVGRGDKDAAAALTAAAATTAGGSATQIASASAPATPAGSGSAAAPGALPPAALSQLASLSSKLSLSEARGIITLTERMRALEKELNVTRIEREDLFARLQGTEQVKEFLVEKLKETEAALTKSLDDKGRAERQSASDLEVIGFLDAKTQEMERVAEESTNKALALQGALENERQSSRQRILVLEDSLRLEKQRTEEYEERSRKERRLLVQEVKKLRALNAAVLAESDGYRKQTLDLRESIKSLGR